jgi:hypothetical protein
VKIVRFQTILVMKQIPLLFSPKAPKGRYIPAGGDENCLYLSDFCDEMNTAFVPTIQGVALGVMLRPFGTKAALVINPSFLRMQESRRQWIPAFAGMTVTDS